MTTTELGATMRALDLPALPGLAGRAFDPDRDYPEVAALIADANAADGTEWIPTEAQLRADWAAAQSFDPRRDLVLVTAGDRLTAMARVAVRERIDSVGHQIMVLVRPELRRRGIGSALLAWAEARAREQAAEGAGGPSDKERFLAGWSDVEVPGTLEFASAAGYELVRRFLLMVRDLSLPIVEAPLPPGLEVRPVRPEDHRRIWDADVEAFLDHFDAPIRTEGDYDAFFEDPNLDTTLWQVAWEGDEVAGSVINAIPREENARLGISRGWLEHVSVRRPWRGRGLASALTTRSLLVLRDQGVAEAALGVDAENPTGALRVYERAGFVRHRSSGAFRKAFG